VNNAINSRAHRTLAFRKGAGGSSLTRRSGDKTRVTSAEAKLATRRVYRSRGIRGSAPSRTRDPRAVNNQARL